jgi:CHAT domain
VTISACDGVGERSYAGEGLVGLSWAFLRAGAHNVIASLWEVNDDSTPKLMDELYKGLRAGQDPATALRNAKLSLVRSAGIFRKPFYWAPSSSTPGPEKLKPSRRCQGGTDAMRRSPVRNDHREWRRQSRIQSALLENIPNTFPSCRFSCQ